jgi:hypothetical protein
MAPGARDGLAWDTFPLPGAMNRGATPSFRWPVVTGNKVLCRRRDESRGYAFISVRYLDTNRRHVKGGSRDIYGAGGQGESRLMQPQLTFTVTSSTYMYV